MLLNIYIRQKLMYLSKLPIEFRIKMNYGFNLKEYL